jgi:hypothetical protein
MRKVTQETVNAFIQGMPKKVGNTRTNGKQLFLHGNLISEHRADGLYVSNAGWNSRTTKERLNALPNVSIQQKKNQWYLNGESWDGQWAKVNSNPPPVVDEDKAGSMMDDSTTWVKTDGWRGYQKPTWGVAGVNDTGGWSDSPCPTHIAEAELGAIATILKASRIPHKKVTLETSNVFCVHHYLIVPPKFFELGKSLVLDYLEKSSTRLLYVP